MMRAVEAHSCRRHSPAGQCGAPFFCALDALAINDRSARAGVPPRQLPACHIERVVNAPERAVVVPSVEGVVQGAARRQVLGDRGPLAARAQDIHEAVDHLAQVDPPLVAAALGGRDQWGNQRPFLVAHVTWVAQLAPVVATTVLTRPHQRLPPDRTAAKGITTNSKHSRCSRMDTEQTREPLELYSDFLDLGRFSGPAHESRMAQYLSDKYKERRPEVVLALGPEALRFVNENRSNLGLDSPIVFCCTSRARLAALGELDDVTGVISEFDLTKTLALAQQLQPDARHLVIVAGATEFDQQWVRIARRQLASFESRYDTTYLAGLRYADLMERLKRLPRDSIVIMLTMFADGAGRLSISPESVQEITKAATAPVYAPYETYLGRCVVGGHVDPLARIGEEIADLALGILA